MDWIYVFSQIFVVINYILLAITYTLKNRKSILVFNFLALIAMGFSYLFLSAWSGFAMVIVALIRNIIFIRDKSENITLHDWVILIALYLISFVSAIFTYNGFFSLLSVFATMLYTLSVWQKDPIIYKILGIPTSILWICYNIFIKSLFGIICESILLVFMTIGLFKFYLNKKRNLLISSDK